MIRRVSVQFLWIACVSLYMVAPPAQAYLDPSTGSMIVSAVVGLFATLSLAIKTYWYRLKALFRRRPPPGEDEAPGSAPSPGPGPAEDGGRRP